MSRSVRSHAMTHMLPAVALAVALVAVEVAEAAEAAERVEVGQDAPGFTLKDPDGREFTASALRGEKNLLLVFFRGAW